MKQLRVLIIGAGIGGLTAGIALSRRGFDVEMIERDPNWAVYGVGIIQQGNVLRAMADLNLLDDYIDAAFGFDAVDIFLPDGRHAARIPSPRLLRDYPANVGIGRPALHKVLGSRAQAAGCRVRLGVTATALSDGAEIVTVDFSDGTSGRYDLVVGADGLYSATRGMIFPDAPTPAFAGQAVWRYNFPRPADVTTLHSYEGPIGIGLVPLSEELMYMFVTTPEPGNPRYERDGLAAAMRAKLTNVAPAIAGLAEQICDDDAVVYRPLETVMLHGDWHKGRVVLLGDAVHATTPHLGQGAGMAIEDAIVLADELAAADTLEQAFTAYRARRIDRCRFIVEASLGICRSQLGTGPRIDQAKATHEMLQVVSEPI